MNLSTLRRRLPQWSSVFPLVESRFNKDFHGDYPRWQAALKALPDAEFTTCELGDTVRVVGSLNPVAIDNLRWALMQLHPWRKGPFDLFGVHIDSEWRSDWKWRRACPHLGSIRQAEILDVGCGNGYFGWRMLGAGASRVVGVDPALLYCMQHLAINHYLNDERNWVLPLRFEELPVAQFDVVFSMGVIYHRRDPLAHARRLFEFVKPGGRLVVESLVVATAPSLKGIGRYARMANVHTVPTPQALAGWLGKAGFESVAVVDVTPTTTDEQRSTRWMRFESLEQALAPGNPTLTVEGHPAPARGLAIAVRPAHGNRG